MRLSRFSTALRRKPYSNPNPSFPTALRILHAALPFLQNPEEPTLSRILTLILTHLLLQHQEPPCCSPVPPTAPRSQP